VVFGIVTGVVTVLARGSYWALVGTTVSQSAIGLTPE
jgi:hypothetical protein